MRRFLAVLLIALALATLAVYARVVMAPLTLNIGSAPIALVQNGPFVIGGYKGVSPRLGSPSTAGTTLVAVLIGDVVTSAPTGWTLAAFTKETFFVAIQIYIYPNNPGGIDAVGFVVSVVSSTTDAQISEWSGVAASSPLETSGTATANAGTTLTPATTAGILNAGDLAIAAWGQAIGAPAAVTFTTPPGWTRLKDNGIQVTTGHDDLEYKIGPAVGVILAPTLTSTGTTTSAAGAVIVLKAAHPVVDQTAYLAY